MAVIAFFTVGDPTVVASHPTCQLTQSDMYRIYAGQVAGPGAAVHGVSTDTDALNLIRAIAPGTLSRALFVGHGGSSGYMFRQRAADDGIFDQNDSSLMTALGQALIPAGGRVEFHACNLVGTIFITMLQNSLANVAIGSIFVYRARMFMLPQTNAQCQITGWTNRVVSGGRVLGGGPRIVTPDFFTEYPFGRVPPRVRP